MSVEARADARRRRALDLLAELQYLERWSALGEVDLTGSVRHDLVVLPDIDVDVYVATLDVEASFAVVAGIAASPRVARALFRNDTARFGGLYWELVCRLEDGEEWTIETYVNGPDAMWHGWTSELAAVFGPSLTPEQRRTILELKEALRADPAYTSMDVYRGTVDGGVRTLEEFLAWRAVSGSTELARWLPGTVPPT